MHVRRALPAAIENPVQIVSYSGDFFLRNFVVFHILLALLMYKVEFVSTLHAVVTLSIGLFWALSGRRIEHVAYIGAYIMGSEVLWRMTHAIMFWEAVKYVLALIFVLAIFRWKLFRGSFKPLFFFSLLVPSVLVTFLGLDFSQAQDFISFNLSGPLALTGSIWLFSNIRLPYEKLTRLFWMMISPILGIVTIALFSTVTATNIIFDEKSNFVTSGGFGPNQVSAMLGLASFLVFFLYSLAGSKERLFPRPLLLGLIILFAAQSAMTFSRTGVYLAAGSVAVAFFFLLRDKRARLRGVAAMIVVFLIGNFLLLPAFDTFTGGAFSRRYANMDPTKRQHIAQADLEQWQEDPIFGVGIGQAKLHRTSPRLHGIAAHTEFTRLLAEHGSFGFLAIVMLLLMVLKNIRRIRDPREKALSLSLITWSVLFMMVSAMRLCAPAYIFGLAFAMVNFNQKDLSTTGSFDGQETQTGVINRRRIRKVTW
jgi:O-antigen ligase